MRDYIGLAESFAFIFALIGIATLLLRFGLLGPAMTRKVVHIGVSHWWLFYLALIASPRVGMLGAAFFVVLNTVSHKLHVFKAMEDSQSRKNLGTIWFPLSLIGLIALEMIGVLTRWQAGVGVLIMGWGDGMAAVIGQKLSKYPVLVFGSRKSVIGTAALIGFSFAVTAIMTSVYEPGLPLWEIIVRSGAMALFAAFVELVTPFRIDNITVPILSALFYVYVASTPLAGPFAAAAALNAIVGYSAYLKRAVDGSGAVIGAGLGTLILTAGGFQAYALLAGFFLSSTAIGRLTEKRRNSPMVEEKGSRRDAFQVLANAGAAAIAAFLHAVTKDPVWLVAFAAAFAAANADTWASEIGVLYRRLPRSILTGKELPAGASGGVTPLGFLASGMGSAFIGLLFAASYASMAEVRLEWGLMVAIASLAGFAGSVVDSMLGAAFQAQYTCVVTGRYTERPHTDGQANVLVRGFRWFTNDVVNFASTMTVTAAAAGIYTLVR